MLKGIDNEKSPYASQGLHLGHSTPWRLDCFSREGALASLGPCGDVIVSLRAPIAAPDLIKIAAHTKAALAKKRAAGVPLGAPRKSADFIEQVRRFKASGASNQAIVRTLQLSPSTVAKYLLP
jgi:DNA invertase Pin-like site-specific DNA recombinase